MKFESHITITREIGDKMDILKEIALRNNMKLTYVADDAVLGVGKWYYINGYNISFDVLLEQVKLCSKELKSAGFDVIREKIEQILYDTKTGYFECGVNCTACLT